MADQKISAMPNAATLTGAELVPLVQSGSNVKSTLSALTTFTYGANASFQDYTNQTIASANTPAVVTFSVTDWATNVTLASGSRITVTNAGKYNFQFSIQFNCTSVQLQDVYVWLRKNGTDIGGSAGLVSVPNSHGGVDGHTIVGWNFFLDLAANDYIQLAWTAGSTTVSIKTIAAGANWPSTASVVMTVNQVS
jgi:hypothetical protein